MGLSEQIARLREKIVRDPLPPEEVAAGWALGVFIGFSIPFGFQLIIALPLAMMMRVSKIGATVATFVTNPATILFIYPAQTYLVSRWLFGGSFTFESLMATEWTWAAVCKLGAEVMASFFLGGILLAAVFTPITYVAVRGLVVRFRRRGGFTHVSIKSEKGK